MSCAPGFVAGYWVHIGEDRGTSMLVFESEEAAQQAMQAGDPPPNVTVESMDMGEVVAHA